MATESLESLTVFGERNARLSHTELSNPTAMVPDCLGTQRTLGLSTEPLSTRGPSLLFADHPHDLPKTEISIPAAAARLSAAYFGD